MTNLIGMLENALERMDETAGDISHGKINVPWKEEKDEHMLPGPPSDLIKTQVLSDELQEQRSELNRRKAAISEQNDIEYNNDTASNRSETRSRSVTPVTNSPKNNLFQDEIALLTREKAELVKGNATLLEEICQQERTIEATKERTTTQITSLLSDKGELESQLQLAITDRDKGERLREEKSSKMISILKEKDKMITDLREAKDHHEDQKQGKVSELEDKIIEIESQRETQDKYIATLQDKASQHDNELRILQRELDLKEEDIRNQNATLHMKDQSSRSIATELEQYKTRYSKAVVEKDKEVASLIQQLTTTQQQNYPSLDFSQTESNNDEETVETLRALEKLQEEYNKLRGEYRTLHTKKTTDDSNATQTQHELEAIIEHQKATANGLHESLSQIQQQLQETQQSALNSKSAADHENRRLEVTVQQLERRLVKREEDLESSEAVSRCRKLGETLLEKQAVLETRNAEVEQLSMKLRTAQQKFREMELLSVSPPKDIEAQELEHPTVYQVCSLVFDWIVV